MSEDNRVEVILSILTTVIGGVASAFLVKKMVDALDTNKKVRLHSPSFPRKSTLQKSPMGNGSANSKRALVGNCKSPTT